VDRLAGAQSARRRVTDLVPTVPGLSGGIAMIAFVDLTETDTNRAGIESVNLADIYYAPAIGGIGPRAFSFHSPLGACAEGTSLGTKRQVERERVVSDPALSLADVAISVWSGGHFSDFFMRLIEALGNTMGFSLKTPWAKLPAAARKALLFGYEDQVHVKYK